MVDRCETVWREVSNYIDGEVDPTLRSAIEEHVAACPRCAAVVTGTRNIVQLYGDERMIEVPLGFSQRLHRRLDADMPVSMPASRRTFLGAMMAAAAALLVIGGLELVRAATSRPDQRAPMARRSSGVPPATLVVVAEQGKLFHRPDCSFIHEKDHRRTMTADEASRQGYTPCVRCLGQYLENG